MVLRYVYHGLELCFLATDNSFPIRPGCFCLLFFNQPSRSILSWLILPTTLLLHNLLFPIVDVPILLLPLVLTTWASTKILVTHVETFPDIIDFQRSSISVHILCPMNESLSHIEEHIESLTWYIFSLFCIYSLVSSLFHFSQITASHRESESLAERATGLSHDYTNLDGYVSSRVYVLSLSDWL